MPDAADTEASETRTRFDGPGFGVGVAAAAGTMSRWPSGSCGSGSGVVTGIVEIGSLLVIVGLGWTISVPPVVAETTGVTDVVGRMAGGVGAGGGSSRMHSSK